MLKLRRWIFIAWTLIPTSPRRKAPDLLKQSPDAIVSKQSPDAIVSSAVRGAQQRGTPVKDAIRDCLLHKDHAVREAAMRVIGPSSYVLFTVFLTDTSRQNGPEPDKRRGRRFNTNGYSCSRAPPNSVIGPSFGFRPPPRQTTAVSRQQIALVCWACHQKPGRLG